MISFIIIGRNEGWKLTLCIKSLLETISFNDVKNFVITYADSNSSDNSLNRALKFENVKVLKLEKDSNPAIARNLGAKVSKGV